MQPMLATLAERVWSERYSELGIVNNFGGEGISIGVGPY
jgi:hypothetical protein